MSDNKRTIIYVTGAYHDEWSIEPSRKHFETAGYDVVSARLATHKPGVTVRDHALVLSGLVHQYRRPDSDITILAWSFGLKVAMRLMETAGANRIIGVAGTVDQSLIAQTRKVAPAALTPLYQGIRQRLARERGKDGLEEISPQEAELAFYHDVSPELSDQATSRLRKQNRLNMKGVSPLQKLPDIDIEYIACSDDRAISYDWQLFVAREVLNKEAHTFDSGHAPHLARPSRFAHDVVEIIEA